LAAAKVQELRIGQVKCGKAKAMARPAVRVELIEILLANIGLASDAIRLVLVFVVPDVLQTCRGSRSLVLARRRYRSPHELERKQYQQQSDDPANHFSVQHGRVNFECTSAMNNAEA
jgi:hypothetical protein